MFFSVGILSLLKSTKRVPPSYNLEIRTDLKLVYIGSRIEQITGKILSYRELSEVELRKCRLPLLVRILTTPMELCISMMI